MLHSYPKAIVGEHWDDFQLFSVAEGFGGNKPLYQLFKEYEVENFELSKKYSHKIAVWYHKRHQSLMNGKKFGESKPIKTWKEALTRTKTAALGAAYKVEKKALATTEEVDHSLFKSSRFGNFWKKITGPKENCDCENCRDRKKTQDLAMREKEQEEEEP